MKLGLLNAILILLAGMLLILLGAFFEASYEKFRHPLILSGLILEFLGTLWLVLTLNQRRKKD